MSNLLVQENLDQILQENGDSILIEDLSIQINNIDRTALIDWKSVKKNETASKKSDTYEFLVKNYGTKTFQPAMNDIVRFNSGFEKVFEGVIVETREEVEGLAKYYSVICKDYTHTLDRRLISKVYVGQTAEAIVTDLITNFTTGFTVVNVVAPVVINYIAFNYLTVSQCLEKLTKMLNGYQWYVDYDKDIHFFATVLNPAPFSLTDTSQNYIFKSLDLKQDTHQLRNDIIIRGGNIASTSPRTEYFDGDGTKLIFPLGLKYNVEPTVTVGGVAQTVGLENIDPEGSHNCYWDYNQKTLRFEVAPPAVANTVVVTGTYYYPLVYRKQNNASILTYGLFQFIIVDKTIVSTAAASQRADVELAQYSNPTFSGDFVTHTPGLKAGQQLTVSSVIRGFTRTYMIQSIQTTLRTPFEFEYKVKLESYGSVGIDDILKKLLITDQSDQLEIGENENIQRSVQFNETAVLGETLNTPVKTSGPYKWGPDANQGTWNRSVWG